MKHGLKFDTANIDSYSMGDVVIFIIVNQLGRRNINKYIRSVLALKLKDYYKAKAKEKQKEHGNTAPGRTLKEKSPKVNTRDEISKIAKVSDNTIAKVESIEKNATPEMKERLKNEEITIHRAYSDIKKEVRKEEYKKNIEKKPLPNKKKYRVIYADPPWQYSDKLIEEYGGAEKHYDTMNIEELCDLPINELTEKNAVLFLWVTSPMLEICFKVINAWGFKYKTSFVWDKVKHNMGHYNSVRHELLLVCTKGSCLPDKKKLYDSVVTVERTNKHSEKPIEFLNIISDLYVGNKIELFARTKKEGWDTWGNQK